MNKIFLISVSSLLIGCSFTPTKSLIGKWKSNEEKTLASVSATEGISEKTKQLFARDFFGKLVVEYNENTYRSWYKNEENTDGPEPYKILEANNKYHMVESISLLSGKEESVKLFWEGECYYLIVSKWKFKEYFCKVD